MSILDAKKLKGWQGKGMGVLKSLIYIERLRTMLNQHMSNRGP